MSNIKHIAKEVVTAGSFGLMVVGALFCCTMLLSWVLSDGDDYDQSLAKWKQPESAQEKIAPKAGVLTGKVYKIPVDVTAYCVCTECCGEDAKGLYCTGRPVKSSDYAFAVSPDLKKLMVLDYTSLYIPGYNKYDTISTLRDTTSKRLKRTIDVIMTASVDGKTPHQRALDWGRKQMYLCARVGNGKVEDLWLADK